MSLNVLPFIIILLTLSISCKRPVPSETTEADFHQITDDIMDIYRPVFEKQGLGLVAIKDWENEEQNAYATRSGNLAFVTMYGGLARNTYMSNDSFAFVVCHEIGHHQAGYPFYGYTEDDPNWASVEGQADHFATTKCLKQYFAGKENQEYIEKIKNIESKLVNVCESNYDDKEQIAICIRASLAAKGFASVQASNTAQKFPSLSLKLKPFSPSYRSGVLDTHPEAACRYQTANAGAICPKNYDSSSVFLEPNEGYCQKGEDLAGFRHECWYNPNKSNAFIIKSFEQLPICLRHNYKNLEHRRKSEL